MKIKKIVSFLLSIVMILSSATYAFAQEQNEKKSNLHFEKGSIEDLLNPTTTRSSLKELIYTYDQNGESYRVYDQANNDLTYTYSSIFKIGKKSRGNPCSA